MFTRFGPLGSIVRRLSFTTPNLRSIVRATFFFGLSSDAKSKVLSGWRRDLVGDKLLELL